MTDVQRHEPGLLPPPTFTRYKDMLAHVREHGTLKTDRTGVGTRECFGLTCRYDLSQGFPIDSLKRVFFRGALVEWLWMLSGSTNVGPLQEKGVHIWDEWADANGELGPVYGAQWRRWQAPDGRVIDQVAELQAQIRKNPDSRRLIINGWNVADLDRMALPPCHTLYHFNVTDGRLSLLLYQRSGDMFLGVPFNQVAGGLWIHALAHVAGLQPGEFVHVVGSAHIYLNHLEQVDEALSREPRPYPTLVLENAPDDILAFTEEHFRLDGYDPHPHIAAPVAV